MSYTLSNLLMVQGVFVGRHAWAVLWVKVSEKRIADTPNVFSFCIFITFIIIHLCLIHKLLLQNP
jgi:hypothetical protein